MMGWDAAYRSDLEKKGVAVMLMVGVGCQFAWGGVSDV